MAKLQLNFLGDLEVIRDGERLPLPPSKKTRALLAYLALNNRSFRREHLCELLWEVPDDPRGSLRWSLSKLRRVVDCEDHARIVADRSHVGFEATEVDMDIDELGNLAATDDLGDVALEVIESAVERYRGHLLEGLELPNFQEFNAWCVASREVATRSQCTLLRHLAKKLSDNPERGLPHARALVALSPYNEDDRALLVRLLVALHYVDEAEQQFRLGTRMLEEVGESPTGKLYRAWQGSTRSEPSKQELPSPLMSIVDLPELDLLGRDREQVMLKEAYAQVCQQGRARFVLLVGEAGIGKSRLLEAVAHNAKAEGASLLEAGTFESGSVRPFALWIDAFRKHDPDDYERVFGTADHGNRDHLFGALAESLSERARQRPTVLLFDDIQWCDDSSMVALHYVARMNRDSPLFGVLAARGDELRDNGSAQQALRGLRRDGLLAEIRLGPLPEEAMRELIETSAPTANSEKLSRESSGNPLMAIELSRAQSEGDSGQSLSELVRERLARFDVDGIEVLQWAAVLAPHIELDVLVDLTGIDARIVGDVLETAERQAMLQRVDRGFRFSHDLISRGVYEEISPARRSVMHGRAAQMLERSLDPDRASDLAHHASLSGDPAMAARAMVTAGRSCLRFFANDDAAMLARNGLQSVTELKGSEAVCLEIDLNDVLLAATPLDDWRAWRRNMRHWRNSPSTTVLSHMRASGITWRATCVGHTATGRERARKPSKPSELREAQAKKITSSAWRRQHAA